jgi:hypothetical protein
LIRKNNTRKNIDYHLKIEASVCCSVVGNKCENVNTDRLSIQFLGSPVINVLIIVGKNRPKCLRVSFIDHLFCVQYFKAGAEQGRSGRRTVCSFGKFNKWGEFLYYVVSMWAIMYNLISSSKPRLTCDVIFEKPQIFFLFLCIEKRGLLHF